MPHGAFKQDLISLDLTKCLIEANLLNQFICHSSILMPFSTENIFYATDELKEQLNTIDYEPNDPNTIVYIASSSGSNGEKKYQLRAMDYVTGRVYLLIN